MMCRLFFLLLIFTASCARAQDGAQAVIKSPQEVQQRIDALLRLKQYPAPPANFDVNNTVSLGTRIKRDTAFCTLGVLKKKSKKKYKPAYVVRYSINTNKIVAIETPKKKKKKFLVF